MTTKQNSLEKEGCAIFTILLVEDDQNISRLLQSHLLKYGFQVSEVTDFEQVLQTFHKVKPDLVLLDVNLPMYDGFYWCRQIRTSSNCPILFLSARDGMMDQVLALENGADDYITKPFHYEIVIAKIRSQLRRAYGSYSPVNTGERTIELEGLVLYPERLQITLGDQKIELTRKESQLLEMLMERSMRVVSRDRLLEKLWDDQMFIEENTLNVHIARVRKKLQEIGILEAIETVRGTGYRMKVTWGDSI